MKKYLFAGVAVLFMCGVACAGYTYTETETITTYERVSADAPCHKSCDKRFVSSRNVKPCVARRAVEKPVRVKTHTEVINHYQVYQPVTVYQPMGVQIERHVIPAKSCNKCRF